MKIAFRVDSSLEIGSGHVMRCLTLAIEARKSGHDVLFISLDLFGNVNHKIVEHGFTLLSYTVQKKKNGLSHETVSCGRVYQQWLPHTLEYDAKSTNDALSKGGVDFLIVDHYAVSQEWIDLISISEANILVIDDLKDRFLACGFLLNQNYGVQKYSYHDLVLNSTVLMLGIEYCLIREEFAQARPLSLSKSRFQDEVITVFINLGGVDQFDYTSRIVDVLVNDEATRYSTHLIITVGAAYPNKNKLEHYLKANCLSFEFYIDADNVARLMAKSDLAIGAAGGMTWERFCLGLPSILIPIADNQRTALAALERDRLAIIIEPEAIASVPVLLKKKQLINELKESGKRASLLVRGDGASKVIGIIEGQ